MLPVTDVNDNSAVPEPPVTLLSQTSAGLPVQVNQGAPTSVTPPAAPPQVGNLQVVGFDGTHYYPLAHTQAGNFIILTSDQSRKFSP